MRYLSGVSFVDASNTYGNLEQVVAEERARLNAAGIEFDTFCLTLNPPGPPLTWKELDARWKRGDRELLGMYERLEKALEGCEVLLNDSGINLHPEFVAKLPVLTVFQCFDDPENSHNLSRPAAAAYDLCLVGNIAELDTYRSWGCRNVEWSPLGYTKEVANADLTYDEILHGKRDIGLFMMIDRLSPWRKARMDQMLAAFPDAHFYGKGWPRGFLSKAQQLAFLRRARIGPNIHNSTGPINYRTFYLPANGVLQICDNKSHLGKIFELGKEAVGFDTMAECVELCRYYLEHEEEGRRIAAAGWKRATAEYSEIAINRRRVALFERYLGETGKRTPDRDLLRKQWERTRVRRLAYTWALPARATVGAAKSTLRAAGINKARIRSWLGKPGPG